MFEYMSTGSNMKKKKIILRFWIAILGSLGGESTVRDKRIPFLLSSLSTSHMPLGN